MGMVVDSALYVGGHRDQSVSIEAARPPEQSGQFVWIGLLEPSEEMLRMVQARFGLHDLAIEDAHRAHQRPKLEVYDHSLFVVLRTAELKGGRVECGETHIFIGPGYVITVRHGASSSYAEVRKRAESKRGQMDTTIGKVGVLLRVTAKFRAHPLVAHVGGRDREAAGAEPGAAIGRATSREVRPHRPPQPTWR